MMEANAIQVRIGELCHQFLPTMGAQSVSRFTAAGQQDPAGGAGAGGRGPPAAASAGCAPIQAACRQVGDLRARPCAPGSAAVNGSFVERGVKCWPSDCPAPARPMVRLGHRLVEAGRSVLFAPPAGAGPAGRQARPGIAARSTTTTSCCWTTWGTCPKGPRSPRCSSRSSPNATNAGPWASRPTWSSPSGSTSSPTQWPRRRPSTGWSTSHPGIRRPQLPHRSGPAAQSETNKLVELSGEKRRRGC